MATLSPGYTGYLLYKGQPIRLSSGSVGVNQEVLSEPTVFGLRDNRLGSGILGGKFDGGPGVAQKTMHRPSVKDIRGNFSFPVTENSPMDDLFSDAATGEDFSATFFFNCDVSTTVTEAKISTFTISCTQGEFVECSVDFAAKNLTTGAGYNFYTDAEKICIWTNLSFSVGGLTNECADSISFSIENPITPIYTSGTNVDNFLLPRDLRIGEQNIMGEINFYDIAPNDFDITQALFGNNGNFSISIAPVLNSKSIPVRYHPVTTQNNLSAISGAIAFTGVDYISTDF